MSPRPTFLTFGVRSFSIWSPILYLFILFKINLCVCVCAHACTHAMHVHTHAHTHTCYGTHVENRGQLSRKLRCRLSERYLSLPSGPSPQPCPRACSMLSSTPGLYPPDSPTNSPPQLHQSECLPVVWRDRHKNIHHPNQFKHESSPHSSKEQTEGQVWAVRSSLTQMEPAAPRPP